MPDCVSQFFSLLLQRVPGRTATETETAVVACVFMHLSKEGEDRGRKGTKSGKGRMSEVKQAVGSGAKCVYEFFCAKCKKRARRSRSGEKQAGNIHH